MHSGAMNKPINTRSCVVLYLLHTSFFGARGLFPFGKLARVLALDRGISVVVLLNWFLLGKAKGGKNQKRKEGEAKAAPRTHRLRSSKIWSSLNKSAGYPKRTADADGAAANACNTRNRQANT